MRGKRAIHAPPDHADSLDRVVVVLRGAARMTGPPIQEARHPMSQWTIAKRLIAGFSAVILVTLLLGGFAFTRLLTIDNDARRIVGDVLPGITAILQMSVNTRENRALMLEHIVAETPAEKAAIEATIGE